MVESKPIAIEELKEQLGIPEGTLDFRSTHPQLFDQDFSGVIFEQVSGQHYFRIERQPKLLLTFTHASPGTGARVATIDLTGVPAAESAQIGFSWWPEGIGLVFRSNIPNAQQLFAKGVASDTQFRIGADGSVFQIGGPGVETAGVRVTMAGKKFLEPTAIDTWREIIRAIEVLSTGASSEGFQYEIVQTNLVISMLVTGFETYTKGRFKEIEAEGVVPNDDALIDETCSKREREKGIQALLLRDAEEEGKSLLAHVADSKINFQNFDRCKSAYNKAYGIRFGEIPQAKEEIESVREFIGYRHKIIHVSPLLAMLAKPGDEAGSKNVVFAKAETATRARKSFDAFINALHNATLQLR